jgi:S-adenosylmethionine:tRNA ribosyltransferase-isomerase
MASAAFSGFDLLQEAYNEAIKKKYRFLAYGDAMIII